MYTYLMTLIENLPPDAYSMYFVLLLITGALIRCSLHPTTFALISWLGTALHEISHGAVGTVLGARPTAMSLFPKALGNGRWQLGSVSFANLKWWSAPWTAMAPMLLAPGSLVLAYLWVYPLWSAGNLTGSILPLYCCATILQASWPSSTDFEVAFPGLLVLGVIAAILW